MNNEYVSNFLRPTRRRTRVGLAVVLVLVLVPLETELMLVLRLLLFSCMNLVIVEAALC